ncbi:MAG: GNAT family N-acetyltransferase [Bacteroidales bacterium]|jgi:GNAT superfamily N-acetyltransferase|nr:GNAT family N-acetyltransferase [Bacteroidales bacterium]
MQNRQVKLRYQVIPGDIGELIRIHGILYHLEYGYDETFEAYVAKGLADFVLNPDPEKGRIWLAEAENKIIGSIAIVKVSEEVAQLRWYLLHPGYRGKGLGKRLLTEAIEYCSEKKFRSIFLWTTSELSAAAWLYKKSGFIKTEEITHVIWGAVRTEEKYLLEMPN